MFSNSQTVDRPSYEPISSTRTPTCPRYRSRIRRQCEILCECQSTVKFGIPCVILCGLLLGLRRLKGSVRVQISRRSRRRRRRFHCLRALPLDKQIGDRLIEFYFLADAEHIPRLNEFDSLSRHSPPSRSCLR